MQTFILIYFHGIDSKFIMIQFFCINHGPELVLFSLVHKSVKSNYALHRGPTASYSTVFADALYLFLLDPHTTRIDFY